MPYTKGDQDELTDLQELCAAKLRLRASVAAAQMPVLTQWRGNLLQQAEAQENQARCIVLYPPTPKILKPNQPGPYFDEIAVYFRVILQPELLEEGDKGSLYWATEILKEFHHQKLNDPDYACAFWTMPGVDNPAPVDHPRKNIHDVVMLTSFGLTQA